MVNAPPREKEPKVVQGYFFCAVGGLFAVVCARRLISRKPLLVLSDSGFEMPASNIGPVAWVDVEHVKVMRINHVPYLTLGVRNAHALLSRQSPVQKLNTGFNRMFFGLLDVGVPLTGLDRSGAEVLDFVDRQIGPRLSRDHVFDLIRLVTQLAKRPDARALKSLRAIFDPAAPELWDEAERILLYIAPTDVVVERHEAAVDMAKSPPEAVADVSLRVTGRMADAQPPETVVMQAKVLLRKVGDGWLIRAIQGGRIRSLSTVERTGQKESTLTRPAP
jgi:hypothetical protein